MTTIERMWDIDPHIQMVICTAYSDHTWEEITQHLGNPDGLLILQKPFQGIEVSQLAHNLTHKWELSKQVRSQVDTLSRLVQERTAELTAANGRLQETIIELERSQNTILDQNEELHRLATRDPLTGCLNRRAFFSKVESLFQTRGSTPSPCSCIMLDIDHFKRFNDLYGHAIGDQILAVVASHVGSGLRPGDCLCRYGGEEFCIVLPNTDYPAGEQIAQRLRLMIELQSGMAIRVLTDLRITASFGVSSTESGGWEPQHLINQADKALYASKRDGRNRVTRYDQLNLVEEISRGTTEAQSVTPDAA